MWEETEHILAKENNNTFNYLKQLNGFSIDLSSFPEKHWRLDKLSIVSPCYITFGQYELYDGESNYRFSTLEEAQKFGERLLILKKY